MQSNMDTDKTPWGTKQGTVFKKSVGQYFVHSDGQVVACSISSKLRKNLVYPTANPTSVRRRVVSVENIRAVDPVAIGDVVVFIDSGDGSRMITEVLPRRNKFSRRAAGHKPLEQVMVANLDQVVAIFAAAQPTPKWGLLDRYLVCAESADLPALICITKLDLVQENLLMEDIQIYERIGYPVVHTSAVTRRGITEFKEVLKNRVSLLVGKSGVGKTTLLNVIQPSLGLRVREVSSRTHKGKHATSHLEMFKLDLGGSVIDTPGMREFGLWDIDETDLARLFPEMRPYLGLCRFGPDCSHTHEPKCAIKEAVEAGHIAPSRYLSYLRMRR